MTITLEITEEAKESLAAQAEAGGLSLEGFLRNLISAQAAAAAPANSAPAVTPQVEDAERVIDELFDLAPVPPEVGEGAMSRRGWYQ